jgi:hypothetical protein
VGNLYISRLTGLLQLSSRAQNSGILRLVNARSYSRISAVVVDFGSFLVVVGWESLTLLNEEIMWDRLGPRSERLLST